MKKNYTTYRFNIFIPLIGILFLIFQSCQRSDEKLLSLGALVKVNLEIAESPTENILISNSKTNNLKTNNGESTFIQVPFSENKTMEISITPISEEAKPTLNVASKIASTITPVKKGVKYNLVVYDQEGKWVTTKTYQYGISDSQELMLDAGKIYTFIAYSINDSESIPNLTDESNLSTATIDDIGVDLMYFKKEIKLVEGPNYLNIVLKHQYSEITTLLTMDPNMTGAITALKNVAITTSHRSASLKLSDNKLLYNGTKGDGAKVVFPSLTNSQRLIKSNPTLIIHPSDDNGILNFESITIDGETKNNFQVKGVKIVPGLKYNLNLNFKTCTKNVSGADLLNWEHKEVVVSSKKGIYFNGVFVPNGQPISRTINAPGADYGFVFDIRKLDNAFNMEVNGIKLAQQEIQFQIDGSSKQNIKFADGSIYEGKDVITGKNIPAVYAMEGTTSNPLIKVVISREGAVTMYGSKTSGGELFPLVLINENKFNVFQWNRTGSNEVKVSQLVDGLTIMQGDGSGKAKISCN